MFVGGLLLRRAADDRPVACGAAAPVRVAPAAGRYYAAAPSPAARDARLRLLIETSCGTVDVRLRADLAPATVGALTTLARDGWYDGTRCHRLVTTATLTALQCGDPTGTGRGGPGFRLAEENLPVGRRPAYPRGTLAMARAAQPGTTGSQFFLVAADSDLPPDYTVAGEVVSGLDVLDRIVAVGTDNGRAPGDGAPRQRVYLDRVRAVADSG